MCLIEPRMASGCLLAEPPVLLARSGHSLGMLIKHSAGGTARYGEWSKGPDVDEQ